MVRDHGAGIGFCDGMPRLGSSLSIAADDLPGTKALNGTLAGRFRTPSPDPLDCAKRAIGQRGASPCPENGVLLVHPRRKLAIAHYVAAGVDPRGPTVPTSQRPQVDHRPILPEKGVHQIGDALDLALAHDLLAGVDPPGPALIAPQGSQVDYRPSLPEEGVVFMGTRLDLAPPHDLYADVDPKGLAILSSQRAQVDHGPILPEKGVHLR